MWRKFGEQWWREHQGSLSEKMVPLMEMCAAGDPKAGLWLISAQGGEPRKLDLPESFRISAAVAGMRELCIHPDGRHIAYTAGRNISEVWVMQNFLPGK